jgi:hypothetical protein
MAPGPAGSGYIVFVDESGDHGLQSIDPAYPVFVLVFCVLSQSVYARYAVPALTEFKFRHFGHDQVVLHEREIRKDIGEFSFLKTSALKDQFLGELSDLIEGTDMTVIASVIRKDRLAERYSYPNNPYELALGFGLERVHKWLVRHQAAEARTTVVLERRGKEEDKALELEFRRVCSGQNYLREPFALEPRFVAKSANVPGLQLADLIARPIGRHVLEPAQANRAYEVIKDKLDRNAGGSAEGWGLKVFP